MENSRRALLWSAPGFSFELLEGPFFDGHRQAYGTTNPGTSPGKATLPGTVTPGAIPG
jgi:hypothetical protein